MTPATRIAVDGVSRAARPAMIGRRTSAALLVVSAACASLAGHAAACDGLRCGDRTTTSPSSKTKPKTSASRPAKPSGSWSQTQAFPDLSNTAVGDRAHDRQTAVPPKSDGGLSLKFGWSSVNDPHEQSWSTTKNLDIVNQDMGRPSSAPGTKIDAGVGFKF